MWICTILVPQLVNLRSDFITKELARTDLSGNIKIAVADWYEYAAHVTIIVVTRNMLQPQAYCEYGDGRTRNRLAAAPCPTASARGRDAINSAWPACPTFSIRERESPVSMADKPSKDRGFDLYRSIIIIVENISAFVGFKSFQMCARTGRRRLVRHEGQTRLLSSAGSSSFFSRGPSCNSTSIWVRVNMGAKRPHIKSVGRSPFLINRVTRT